MSAIMMRVSKPGEMRGALKKLRKRQFAGWKKRVFVTRDAMLLEFEENANHFAGVPKRVYDLAGSYVEDAAALIGRPTAFRINLVQAGRTVTLLAQTMDEKRAWMEALRDAAVLACESPTTFASSNSAALHSSAASTSTVSSSRRSSAVSAAQSASFSPPGSPLSDDGSSSDDLDHCDSVLAVERAPAYRLPPAAARRRVSDAGDRFPVLPSRVSVSGA